MGGGPPEIVSRRARNDVPTHRYLRVPADGGHSRGYGWRRQRGGAVRMIFVEVKPVAVAVKVIEPGWLADWTMTWARPQKTDR